MWSIQKSEPCVCPVDKSTTLGYRIPTEAVSFYCDDCNWTFKWPANKKAPTPHCRGKVKVPTCGCGCGR